MAGKKAQKKPATPASAPKPVGSTVRDVGIDVPIPEKPCTDPKCPFHARLSVRGQTLEGVVVSTRMQNTAVTHRQYLRFIRKYQRYENRTHLMKVNAPPRLVRQRRPFRRPEGMMVQFEDNACVIVTPEGEVKGSDIKGPVAREAAERWPRVAATASMIV